jgi:GST-like protein
MIELHYVATPNGQKVSIMLEETGLPYEMIVYDIFEGDQHTAAFGKVNPNHKLPAIVDRDPAFGGGPHAVFESGAVLQYLAEKTGMFLPKDPRKRSTCIQWLTWQMAGMGPMGGQMAHFVRYAPEQIPYAIERYSKEVDRLLTVLDRRLAESEYVGCDEFSIADMALWPGRRVGGTMGIAIEKYPNTYRWVQKVGERAGVQRGVSEKFAAPKKYMGAKQILSAKEWSNMFGETMHNAVKL